MLKLANFIKNIVIVAIFLLVNFGFLNVVNAQIIPNIPPASFAGIIEGEGTHFETKDSAYLNLALDSSEPIKLRVESIPEMITMMIEKTASTSTDQTQIIIKGFVPSATYYLYEDDYHNLTEFITDTNGNYSYAQDLSKPHFVFIQPRIGTKFIKDNPTGGDCYLIGIWNSSTKTCTLIMDVNETIQIDDNNLTLDGNNHNITGTNTGMGVYLYQKLGVTIKYLSIGAFSDGVRLYRSSGNTLSRNSVSNNKFDGTSFYYSDNNTINDNILTNNGSLVDTIYRSGSGSLIYFSRNNVFQNNIISDNFTDGIILLFSDNNALLQNTIFSNEIDGISLSSSNNNTIKNNTVDSNIFNGISLGLSSHSNTLEDNIVSSTILNFGVYLRESNNNIVKNNTLKLNKYAGIYILYANNNVFTNNNILNNYLYGIDIILSNNNQFYNNNFINNPIQALIYPGSIGNIFNLLFPAGGNYWSNFDSSAEGCNNINTDSFCDIPYFFYGGRDDFPWTIQDGWKMPVNQPPTFSNLGQFKSDKTTTISEGGITTESSFDDPKTGVVTFKAIINDPDNNQVKLQIELKEWNQPFDSQDLLESDLAASGSEVAITRNVLFERQYHWRARAADNQGNQSQWQEFGVSGNVDFEVKLVPLYTQVRSTYPSREKTDTWDDLLYGSGNYSDCLRKDPQTSQPIPNTSTIARCGCVITSEVMIMRFHEIITDIDGNDVNPKTYNEWLTANNGYYPDGDIKWPKINYYSKNQFGVSRLLYHGLSKFKDTTTLDGYLSDLNPTILYERVSVQGTTTSHYIVADGKLSNTYTIRDPAWYNTRRLNQTADSFVQNYYNNFYGLRLFSSVAVLPDSISVHFASPAEMLFTDPQGRKLGKDPVHNVEYNEISGGVYYQESIGNPFPESSSQNDESKNIWIPEPVSGQYDIQVIGTGSGDYTLDILTYDQTGNSKDITQTGNILSDITQEFELNYSAVSAEQTKLQRIVNIDIKPGSDPNSINCKNRKEVISVAIITTNIFDATTVDANTVKFGPTGAKETHRDKKTGKAQSHMEDVDSDGDLDLVLHFRFSDTGIQCGDANATLTGKTNDNFDIAGLDSIRTVQSDNQSIVIRLLAAISGVFSSIVQKIL